MLIASPKTVKRVLKYRAKAGIALLTRYGALKPGLPTLSRLDFGGPGSGCHGPNCGRPKTSAGVMKQYGFKKVSKYTTEHWKKGMGTHPETLYKHPTLGSIAVNHSGGFKHYDAKGFPANGQAIAKYQPLGKFSSNLHKYVDQLANGPKNESHPASVDKVQEALTKLGVAPTEGGFPQDMMDSIKEHGFVYSHKSDTGNNIYKHPMGNSLVLDKGGAFSLVTKDEKWVGGGLGIGDLKKTLGVAEPKTPPPPEGMTEHYVGDVSKSLYKWNGTDYVNQASGEAWSPSKVKALDTLHPVNEKGEWTDNYGIVSKAPLPDSVSKDSSVDEKANKSASTSPPNGVNQDVHDLLNQNGFQFEKYGEKTKAAVYKNTAGEHFWVKDGDTFSHQSTNYTDKKGIAELTDTISKIEKPVAAPAVPAVVKNPWRDEMPGDPKDYVEIKTPYTQAEKDAVDQYKIGSSGINSHSLALAKGDPTELHNNVLHIDSALSKAVTKQDMIVFRGLGGEYGQKVADTAKPGTFLKANYFQEATTASNTALSFGDRAVLRINVQKGTPAIPTTAIDYASHKSERGIIFSNSVYYRVKDVYENPNDYKKRKIVEVDLIHPGITQLAAAAGSLYVKLVLAAARLNFTPDQLDQALTKITNSTGEDITPPEFVLLRQRLQAEMQREKM